jgi:glycosyltransferase involved in cell wall biosynthesis
MQTETLLSIIIPYFNETPAEMFLTLCSLSGQVGVDFDKIECLMVNDGSGNVLPSEFLSQFAPLNIRCIYLQQNGGAGMARQAGIDQAAGQYVMFCDADDALHNILALHSLCDEIQQYSSDIIYTSIFVEKRDRDTGAYSYELRERPLTVMHGKAYKLEYLKAHNIRFIHGLRLYEDSYFNGVAFSCTVDIRANPAVTYVRKHRASSLTRADDVGYFIQTLPEYITSIGSLMDCLSGKNNAMLQTYAVQFTVYFYFTLTKRHWSDESRRELLLRCERTFAERIIPHISSFEAAPAEMVRAEYDKQRPDYFTGETEIETITEWVERLKLV